MPWVIPILLIVVGLMFVVDSLSNDAKPSGIAAPPNVRNVTVYNAPAWALRQVDAGSTSKVVDVEMAESKAINATSYVIRAAIARVDSPLPPPTGVPLSSTLPSASTTVVRTVVTCVRWNVDVSTGTIVERGSVDLSSRPGEHGIGDVKAARTACVATSFP